MDTKSELKYNFLSQDFGSEDHIPPDLDRYTSIAAGYAQVENAIAVLSDLKECTSYIFYGGMAETLGLCSKGECHHINSIWEEEIFKYIPQDDLEKKHLDELRFVHFLKNRLPENFSDYRLITHISITGSNGQTHHITHRINYIATEVNGSIRLALCIYGFDDGVGPATSYIHNTASGEIFRLEQQDYNDMLSEREKEILQLIDQGRLSKEIADALSISIHTVNRHRQNILSKLGVSNSIEACRIAKRLNLI